MRYDFAVGIAVSVVALFGCEWRFLPDHQECLERYLAPFERHGWR